MSAIDWEDTALGKPYEVTIGGKSYALPVLGWLDEIKIQEDVTKVIAGNESEITEEDFLVMLLGDQLKAMRDNNAPPAAIIHASRCARVYATRGREAADEMWRDGPRPELVAAERAAVNLITSQSTAVAGSSTRRQANTSGTRSTRKTASKSTGQTSSRSRRS